jgi:heat shock protein HslJ
VLSGVNWTTEDVSGFKITIEFAADAVSGFSGVNRYNGGYTSAKDGTLKFGALATTLMAGDEAAMKIESEYLAALAKVTNYSASDKLLDMFAGPDQTLTFTRAN